MPVLEGSGFVPPLEREVGAGKTLYLSCRDEFEMEGPAMVTCVGDNLYDRQPG